MRRNLGLVMAAVGCGLLFLAPDQADRILPGAGAVLLSLFGTAENIDVTAMALLIVGVLLVASTARSYWQP